MPRNKVINEQMREESHKKILATAGRLFAQQGFFNVRIAEIAQEAGMSPGNIYWYFQSKEEILKAILGNFFLRMDEILAEAETWPGSGLVKINHLVDFELDFMREHGDDFQIFMSVLGHGGTQFMKEQGFDMLVIGAGYHQHLGKILEKAFQEGSIPSQNASLLVMSFFAFFNGLWITYGKNLNTIPSDFIHQEVLRLMGRCEETPSVKLS